jgi:DMSO/TMAO reductase YedYZ molybdopterin-dependent catalytic subunit
LGAIREMRRWWPRRVGGLPPGQRALDGFPRFADDPRRLPPPVPGSVLRISSANLDCEVAFDEIRASALAVTREADFHCVTTWTARRQRWTGVPLAVWWTTHIGPIPGEGFAVVGAADGYRAVFMADDLFADDVLLAWALNDAELDQRHGLPLRLVSPAQYGYKNVKHVESIELCDEQPTSGLGPKEHLRARVAFEERHRRLPGRVLRWPYRLVVPVTAMAAERALRTGLREVMQADADGANR